MINNCRGFVEDADRRFESIEQNMNARLNRLEDFLSRTQRTAEPDYYPATGRKTTSNQQVQRPAAGLSELSTRIEKLEGLQKLNAARTCYELKALGVTQSGEYELDPDGPGGGYPPVRFYCDLRTGTTRIDHDNVGENLISSCAEKGCFVQRIRYRTRMKQIAGIIELSEHCEQHIRVS